MQDFRHKRRKYYKNRMNIRGLGIGQEQGHVQLSLLQAPLYQQKQHYHDRLRISSVYAVFPALRRHTAAQAYQNVTA